MTDDRYSRGLEHGWNDALNFAAQCLIDEEIPEKHREKAKRRGNGWLRFVRIFDIHMKRIKENG
jgi:hypothetical protein